MASMSGLALMQSMLQGGVPAPPISRTLDFMLVEVEAPRRVPGQAGADARLVGPDDRLYAHGSTTGLIFDLQRQRA
jgi:hypothetical protein